MAKCENWSRSGWCSLIFAAFLLLIPTVGMAHPMGNFSISHYAGIVVEGNAIQIRYFIDMAEIPTFQEIQQNGLVTKPEDATTRKYLASQSESLKKGLVVLLNGEPLSLQTDSADVIFPPGAGGLPTMKLGFTYRAVLPRRMSSGEEFNVSYRDDNFPSRVGWKEVVVSVGDGWSIVSSSAPQKDRSSQLTNYPTDMLNSPPLDVAASLRVKWEGVASNPASVGVPRARLAPEPSIAVKQASDARQHVAVSSQPSPVIQQTAQAEHEVETTAVAQSPDTTPRAASASSPMQANQQRTPQNRFTELMTNRQTGTWFLIVAAAIAAGLGALHALEPGHGKTVVAAYLVGSRGTAYHAFLLGMIVTVSHTAGVYALGAVTLYASKYIVPEQLYPWMGAISGLMIAALGSYLFMRRLAGHEVGHSHGPGGHHHHHGALSHSHGDAGEHTHDKHDVAHDHGRSHPELAANISYRQLLALGITGGIVPCPAALVVLLSAVALNRVAFGLFLIVAFSVGLAAVLIAVGLLMVYARKFMASVRGDGLLISRWLPLTSAAVITVLGMAIAIRALITGGILQIKV